MGLNKFLKTSILLLLVLFSVFAIIGCNKLPDFDDDGDLENQRRNYKYYFQQGYMDEWSANFDMDDDPLETRTMKLFEMWPDEFEGQAMYTIYKGDTGLLRTTILEVMQLMLNEDNNLYFNSRFSLEDEERQNFEFTSEDEKATYNRNQFRKVSYAFTNDEVEWVGDMFLLMEGSKYFVITWEREASIKDDADLVEQFFDSISDFRKTGFEDERG